MGSRNHHSQNAESGVIMKVFACLLFALDISAAACGTTPDRDSSGSNYDLADRFAVISGAGESPGSGNSSFVRHFQVVRNGDRRDAILLVAPVSIRASLSDFSGSVLLSLLSTPVFNIGDGIKLDVFLVGPGGESRIFSRYFDPGRQARDRAWIPLEIPVELDGAGRSQVEIRVSAGPRGDLVGDWLALSDLRIVQKGGRH